MNPYQYWSEDFALSEEGIHLLRNGYNYKTVPFQQVNKATIGIMADVKRPYFVFLVGILLLLAAALCFWSVYNSFLDPTINHINIQSFIVPLFPSVIGVYCLYVSTRKTPVLLIVQGQSKNRLRLGVLLKINDPAVLLTYLSEMLSGKLEVDPAMKQWFTGTNTSF